jgi:hypothetical protein
MGKFNRIIQKKREKKERIIERKILSTLFIWFIILFCMPVTVDVVFNSKNDYVFILSSVCFCYLISV